MRARQFSVCVWKREKPNLCLDFFFSKVWHWGNLLEEWDEVFCSYTLTQSRVAPWFVSTGLYESLSVNTLEWSGQSFRQWPGRGTGLVRCQNAVTKLLLSCRNSHPLTALWTSQSSRQDEGLSRAIRSCTVQTRGAGIQHLGMPFFPLQSSKVLIFLLKWFCL